MGLDITAMRKLRVAKEPVFDEDGQVEDFDTQWKPGASMEWSESVFPGRGEGVDANTVYEWEDSFSFRAGSYSGYGMWRRELEKFKGNVAFQELIDFADNEGVIGSVVAKKLFKDFTDYENDAEEYSKNVADSDGEWFIRQYRNWKKAFGLASDNGAVEFH